jgi:hypothetical protein
MDREKMNDLDDIEVMLRQQIQIQQLEIDRLNAEILMMRLLTSNQTLYDATDNGDVWMIEKRKADEFKG